MHDHGFDATHGLAVHQDHPHPGHRRGARGPIPVHPGTPTAMAPVVYILWQQFPRFDPADPIWPNRDRFSLPAPSRG
jgi:hypothetical protein